MTTTEERERILSEWTDADEGVPIIMGGQDHSAEAVTASATWVVFAIVAVLLVIVGCWLMQDGPE